MKWILPGNLLFDTMKATLVASWSNGRHFRDPAFIEENLYRSERGGFYLVGNRIAGTASSEAGDDRCRLVSPEEALKWCVLRGAESAAAEHLAKALSPA